ncbi:hypothetical protein KCU63_g35, partial [Aureobasidium melanogenum]
LSLATVLGLLGVRQGKTSGWTSENSLVGSLYSFMGSGHGSPGGGGVGCCHISFHISGGDLRCIDRTVILDDRKLFGDATGGRGPAVNRGFVIATLRLSKSAKLY